MIIFMVGDLVISSGILQTKTQHRTRARLYRSDGFVGRPHVFDIMLERKLFLVPMEGTHIWIMSEGMVNVSKVIKAVETIVTNEFPYCLLPHSREINIGCKRNLRGD